MDPVQILIAIATIAAVFVAWMAYRQSQIIHKEQTELAKKQAFVAVFDHLKDLQYIDVDKPNWIHAAKSANLLEFIAVAWEKGIVDKDWLFDIYGALLVTIFEQLRDAKDINTRKQHGKKMLRDNPAAIRLYKKWKPRIKNRTLSRLTLESKEEALGVPSPQTKDGSIGKRIGR